MTGFFGTNHFCEHCKKGYGQDHFCTLKCNVCQGDECKNFPELETKLFCDKCTVYFNNEVCFNTHKI